MTTAKLRIPSLSTLFMVAGVVVAINLVVLAVVIGSRADDDFRLPTHVTALIPDRGDTIRPQSNVGADLDDTYTATLYIDDELIPEDQLLYPQPDPLGRVIFRPGPDNDIKVLAPGPHRATIDYRSQELPEEEVEGSVTWTFIAG